MPSGCQGTQTNVTWALGSGGVWCSLDLTALPRPPRRDVSILACSDLPLHTVGLNLSLSVPTGAKGICFLLDSAFHSHINQSQWMPRTKAAGLNKVKITLTTRRCKATRRYRNLSFAGCSEPSRQTSEWSWVVSIPT
jgi:hypothetical protein